MIRPFRSEVERYGEYSKAGEFVYDHPFLWGSKRTGPDLHRIGKKYGDSWHLNHMADPSSTSPGSIMPSYGWLIKNKLDDSDIENKMRVMVKLGVPYSDEEITNARVNMKEQSSQIVENLYQDPAFAENYEADKKEASANGQSFTPMNEREIVAMIAYLQRMGTDIKVKDSQTAKNN
jgi:cytochrome c oxidase cbb3-type subunit I/II